MAASASSLKLLGRLVAFSLGLVSHLLVAAGLRAACLDTAGSSGRAAAEAVHRDSDGVVADAVDGGVEAHGCGD